MKIEPKIDENILKNLDTDEKMIESAITAAGIFIEESGEAVPESVGDIRPSGARFVIPMVIPEDTLSGDERIFNKNSITVRDLPLPLMWQIATGDGHAGSVVVARIDTIERVENGLGNARGVFDTGVYGREAERLVREGFLRGVSADLDQFEASVEGEDDEDDEELENKKNSIKNKRITVDAARLMGVTIVPKPAFQEAYIMLEEENLESELVDIPDGEYEDVTESTDQYLATLTASSAPVVPPRSWFQNPKFKEPMPLTVDDSGKVFGHLALWESTHIGMAGKVRPPRSSSDYKYFRSGVVRTDDGTDVTVGQITLTSGHASTLASAEEAVKHYDDTKSGVVDVVAGEDRFGIWVAGALRPDVTPQQVRALRASGISGDWRPIKGRLELVAACAVNCAGFPIARAMVASGHIASLTAAGSQTLVSIKENSLSELSERLERVEQAVYTEKKEALLSRMKPSLEAKKAKEMEEQAALTASVERLKKRFNGS